MSEFSKFMKKNKTQKPNAKYAPTKSLCDESGKPLEWEFRHITSKENEDIRESCTIEAPVTGKPGQYRQKIKTGLYIRKMIVASTVIPNLYNAELQDSYGVSTPEDLLMELVDDPGEYADLMAFIQQFQGFGTIDEEVEEAKN